MDNVTTMPESKLTLFKIIVWIFVVAAFILGAYYLWSTKFSQDTVSTEELLVKNENFARAADILNNGGSKGEARAILEGELQKAEQAERIREAGIIKLYIGISQLSNSNDAASMAEPAKTFVEVATDIRYPYQTRSYAYAYIGEIFARVLALKNPQANTVLDIVLSDPFMKNFKIMRSDGTVDYRESGIRLLSAMEKIRNSKETPNPILLARIASLTIRGVELGEIKDPNDRQGRIESALTYLNGARSHEAVFKSPDVAKLYPSYLYLTVQVYGLISVIENGKYKDQVKENVDELYQKVLTTAVASGDRGTEAGVRYNFAKYLMLKYKLKASHTAQEDAALQTTLDQIFKPFVDQPALRETSLFGIIVNYSKNKDRDPINYAITQGLSGYSPVFKSLLAL